MFSLLAFAILMLQGPADLAKHFGINEPYEAFTVHKCDTNTKKSVIRYIAWEARLVYKNNLLTVYLPDKKKKPFVAATLRNCTQIGETAVATRKLAGRDTKTYIRRINAR